MKITEQIQKLKEIGMSTADKQQQINVSEVFHLWSHLAQRYNILYITKIMNNFTEDKDLKIVITMGIKTLERNIDILEKEMLKYGIPLPNRPPKETQVEVNIEEMTDRYIFRRILRGIQAFLPTHTMAFIHSTTPKFRALFMSFLVEEMKIYDKLMDYGALKGYAIMPPPYRGK